MLTINQTNLPPVNSRHIPILHHVSNPNPQHSPPSHAPSRLPLQIHRPKGPFPAIRGLDRRHQLRLCTATSPRRRKEAAQLTPPAEKAELRPDRKNIPHRQSQPRGGEDLAPLRALHPLPRLLHPSRLQPKSPLPRPPRAGRAQRRRGQIRHPGLGLLLVVPRRRRRAGVVRRAPHSCWRAAGPRRARAVEGATRARHAAARPLCC